MTVKGQAGEQLKLFYRPSEIMDRVDFSYDADGDDSMGSMWARKEREARLAYGTPDSDPYAEGRMAHGAGVYDAIKSHGVTSHVQMASGEFGSGKQLHYLLDGHHRVAAAAAVERDTGREMHVPVLHGDVHVDTPSGGFYPAEGYWPQNYNKKWDSNEEGW